MVQVCDPNVAKINAGQCGIVECFPTATTARVIFAKGSASVFKLTSLQECLHIVTNRAGLKLVRKFAFTPDRLEEFLQRDFILHPSRVPLGKGVLMDLGAMDCLACEALWRIGAETATVLPTVLVQTLVLADTVEDIDLHKAIVEDYFKRSDLILVPITQGGHFTLLACEAVEQSRPHNEKPALRPTPQTTAPRPIHEHIGCGKCDYNAAGCGWCEHGKFKWREYRTQCLAEALDPLKNMKELVDVEAHGRRWYCRHHDSLPGRHSGCDRSATRFLQRLGITLGSLSPVQTWVQPSNWECGYFVRTMIEDELRRHRGEGSFTARVQVDTATHFEWLQEVCATFLDVVDEDAFEDGGDFASKT